MFTINEFAKLVNRSVPTIRWWLQNNLIEKKMFAGSIYFTQDDVERAKELKTEMTKKRTKAMHWEQNDKNN